jgi:hypothetical protein
MHWIRTICLALGLACLNTIATAQTCYEVTVVSPTPLLGNHDEVVRLSDDSFWRVQYEYEYMYQYNPSAVICPGRRILIVAGKQLDVVPLSGSSAGVSASVIESKIDGEFNGWDGETIFVLQNGQIWQQAEYDYEYEYAYSPDVVIFRSGNSFEMQVEGMDESIRVTRVR